jgi:hypothetical protein
MTQSALAQGRQTATRRRQNQDSDKTFTEALAEYYAVNSGKVFRPKDLSEESAELFLSHDICHVIFGLDTTLADEAMVDAVDAAAGFLKSRAVRFTPRIWNNRY